MAKALESGDIYNFAAHYYTAKGWVNIGKVDTNYRSYAVNDLIIAANKISELVAYLTAMNIELAYDTSESNELLEQTTGKIEFFQNLLTSIDSAVKEIEESQKPNKEVKVKIAKTKKEFSPNLSKLDLLELENLGVETIFELEQYKIKQKWQGTIFVGCCSIVQMAVGACIAIGTLGGGITIASSIFVEGLMDAYKVAMSLKQHQAINLNDYLTSKAINYAIIGAQVGFDKLANAGKTGVAAKEAGKTAAELKVAEAIGGEAAKHSSKELMVKTVIELAKASGVQLAKMIVIEKVTELAVKAVNDNALSGLEKKIENQVASNVTAALNSHNGILLSGYSRLEQELIIRAVQQACFNVTKTSKHTRVLNELTSGVFCAAGSHYPVGALLHGVQRTAVTVDAISKIEPILDDIKEQAIKIITKLAEQANVRLNGKTLTSEHAAIRESLSHNIGKIAANAVMNFINRKVTAPIIGQLTSSVVNDLLKDFQAKQHETLAAYRPISNIGEKKAYKELYAQCSVEVYVSAIRSFMIFVF